MDAQETPVESSLKSRRPRPTVHHPTPRQYVNIAILLGVITSAEVAVYYIESLRGVLVALILGFMAIKFTLVVRWFMHVKFDAPGYGRIFATGLALALTIYMIVLIAFGTFR